VVPSDEGPHRKYYGLNERGRSALDKSAKTWGSLTRALDQLLDGRSTANAR
jgi:PadR family transcriptional regulator PadR